MGTTREKYLSELITQAFADPNEMDQEPYERFLSPSEKSHALAAAVVLSVLDRDQEKALTGPLKELSRLILKGNHPDDFEFAQTHALTHLINLQGYFADRSIEEAKVLATFKNLKEKHLQEEREATEIPSRAHPQIAEVFSTYPIPRTPPGGPWRSEKPPIIIDLPTQFIPPDGQTK